jgi:hypothetical protein
MNRIALPLSIITVSLLAACAAGPNSPAGPTASKGAVAQQMPYYAGNGVVQSVTNAPSMASAGGTVTTTGGSAVTTTGANPAANTSGLQRLGIRMDDGRMVYVDTSSRDFPVGTRVRLTSDRLIEKQ